MEADVDCHRLTWSTFSSQNSKTYDPFRLCFVTLRSVLYRASDIWRKKMQNFVGFSGANSRKNRLISRDFCGRKVKIRKKIGWFRRILAQKSQISKDFRGLYYYMRNFCNLIGLEQWYFSLIWNTYMWKLQPFAVSSINK